MKPNRVELAYREFREALGDLTIPEVPTGFHHAREHKLTDGALRYQAGKKTKAKASAKRVRRSSGCVLGRTLHKWLCGSCERCGVKRLEFDAARSLERQARRKA